MAPTMDRGQLVCATNRRLDSERSCKSTGSSAGKSRETFFMDHGLSFVSNSSGICSRTVACTSVPSRQSWTDRARAHVDCESGW